MNLLLAALALTTWTSAGSVKPVSIPDLAIQAQTSRPMKLAFWRMAHGTVLLSDQPDLGLSMMQDLQVKGTPEEAQSIRATMALAAAPAGLAVHAKLLESAIGEFGMDAIQRSAKKLKEAASTAEGRKKVAAILQAANVSGVPWDGKR